MNMIIGYARVSTIDQNLDRQIDSLNDVGVVKLFTEKATGRTTERPELVRMIDQLREGDIVIIHYITQETLEQVILSDIRHYAQAAVKDEKSLTDKLMSASGRERERERSAKRQAMSKLQKRTATIDKTVRQLFEEKVSGSIPDTMFRKMLTDYEREQKELENQIRVLDSDIQADINTERDVLAWMGLIKGCLSMESLDRETAYRLIDSIAVSEKAQINGKRQQNVSIQYHFVGCLDQ